MKLFLTFALGAVTSAALLIGAVVTTTLWAVISVIINGGHPWPYDRVWMFGVIPAGFFVLFAAILYLVFRKVEFVKNALKQLIFYLGTLFGAAAFAGAIFLLVSFARIAHS